MASSVVLPALPKSVFNPALHRAILGLWFDVIEYNTTKPTDAAAARWFGMGPAEQAAALDAECQKIAGPALDVLSPQKYPLPAWKSYEEDAKNTFGLSRPLRQVIHDDGAPDTDLHRADVARSLVLLLDQMPRNTMRDDAGQRRVYGHYDRLARALAHSITAAPGAAPDLDVAGLDTALHAASPAWRQWFYMPFMHSEHLPDHDAYSAGTADIRARVEAAGDTDALKYVDMSVGFEARHRKLIERFGRYPHRNEAVGRESTEEELLYLKEGGETFGTKK